MELAGHCAEQKLREDSGQGKEPTIGSNERESSGREFSQRFWTVEDGLPQSTPLALTQTRDGYLWVGTFNGLARFDGVRFTSFTTANTPQLVSDGINALSEDRAGNLWIATRAGGLVRYTDGRFQHLSKSREPSPTEIRSLAEARDGTLWVGTGKGLYCLSEDKLVQVSIPGTPPDTSISGLSFAANGNLWVGLVTNVIALHEGRLVCSIATPKQIRQVTGDRAGSLWVVFAPGGLARIETRTAELTTLRLASRADAIHEGKDGSFWLGTFHGNILKATSLERTNFSPRLHLSDRGIAALYQDHEGNLWAGVEGGGLCRLRETLVRTYGSRHGLTTPYIASLLQDSQGQIWAGTFGKGVHRWNKDKFERVSIGKTVFNVTTLAETADGSIWFGTFGESIIRRTDNDRYETQPGLAGGFRAVYADRQGGLWFADINGGCGYYKGGRVTSYTTRDGLPNEHVSSFAQDSRGDVWIGTLQGLSRMHDGKITSFSREDGLGGNEIRALFVDSRDILWAGSSGGGLTRCENGGFRVIRSEHGLINDRIEQILEDDIGNLWLGSTAGIMRVSLQELDRFAAGGQNFVHAVAFRREDGLLATECGSGFQPSSLKTSTGQLWFATDAGIAVIDPRQIIPRQEPPGVHIEQIIIDGKVCPIVREDSREPESRDHSSKRSGISKLVVPPGAARIEFHYTGIDLSAPSMVRFRYRLEKFDTDWINGGIHREAIYTRVPPGTYRFQVVAANNQGIWNASGASLAMVVQPFLWQTIPFRIAAVAAAFSAAALVIWQFQAQRHRRTVAEIERRHALEIERARIAQDMHDGLGSSLVKISLLGDLVEHRLPEDAQTRSDLRRITQTAREAVRDMDEIVWAVNPKHDTLDSLAGYLGQFAHEHFANTSIDCHLDIPGALPARPLSADFRHHLFLATREALNNVLKHSQASEAWLRLSCHNGTLTLAIEDNGCGSVSAKSTGDGLDNMLRRVREVGGQVQVESTLGKGTRVKFTLPLS